MYWKLMRGLLCVLFTTIAATAFAQTARFTGHVTDPQGAAIPNAKVQIVNLDTLVSREVTTNDSGEYTAPYLSAGSVSDYGHRRWLWPIAQQ